MATPETNPDILSQPVLNNKRRLWLIKYLCFLIFMFSPGFTGIKTANGAGLPKQSEIDSLKSALTKMLSPQDKIKTLYSLCKKQLDESDLNNALKTSDQLFEAIGKNGNLKDSAKCYRLVGLVYLQMAWYDKSLDNLMQAQHFFDKSGDTLMKAKALMNIGTLHDCMGNLPMSLSYYNEALNFFKQINNESGVADCELNMAILLTKQKKFESACEKLISAAGIYEKTGNVSNLAAAYLNLGLTYKKMKSFGPATDYLERAYEIWKKADARYYICYYNLNMGEMMLDMKKPDDAYHYLLEAEKIAKSLYSKDLLARSYEFLSDYNAAKKNYSDAYTYLNKSKQINDSILNAETTEKVNQIQYHYEIAQREADNQKLVKENLNKELQLSKQNTVLYMLSVILVFIAVLVIFLVNQNRIKRKANLQLEAKNVLIETQKDELIKLNASKDKFLSILAHDIRNPLSSIFGISDMLVSDYTNLTETEKMDFSQDIHTLSVNLFEIINTLLTWSTSQSGMITYRPTTFPFAQLCEKSINTLQTVAKQKDIALVNNANDELTVYADENMIYSVLHNLLNNAIKFSYIGAEIRIETKMLKGFAEISVIDTGIGLAPESQAKLFQYDQHVLSKGTAGESGTGLGLILCKDFVEKNGGTIRVESELTKGSTFVFTIPKST